MALMQVASLGGDAVVLSVDINNQGIVVGAQLDNRLTGDVAVVLSRGADVLFSGTFPPGTHTRNIPSGRRFTWQDAAEVRYDLTPVR